MRGRAIGTRNDFSKSFRRCELNATVVEEEIAGRAVDAVGPSLVRWETRQGQDLGESVRTGGNTGKLDMSVTGEDVACLSQGSVAANGIAKRVVRKTGIEEAALGGTPVESNAFSRRN